MYYLPIREALRAQAQKTRGHYYIISHLEVKVNNLAWANDNKIKALRIQSSCFNSKFWGGFTAPGAERNGVRIVRVRALGELCGERASQYKKFR